MKHQNTGMVFAIASCPSNDTNATAAGFFSQHFQKICFFVFILTVLP